MSEKRFEDDEEFMELIKNHPYFKSASNDVKQYSYLLYLEFKRRVDAVYNNDYMSIRELNDD